MFLLLWFLIKEEEVDLEVPIEDVADLEAAIEAAEAGSEVAFNKDHPPQLLK